MYFITWDDPLLVDSVEVIHLIQSWKVSDLIRALFNYNLERRLSIFEYIRSVADSGYKPK